MKKGIETIHSIGKLTTHTSKQYIITCDFLPNFEQFIFCILPFEPNSFGSVNIDVLNRFVNNNKQY